MGTVHAHQTAKIALTPLIRIDARVEIMHGRFCGFFEKKYLFLFLHQIICVHPLTFILIYRKFS